MSSLGKWVLVGSIANDIPLNVLSIPISWFIHHKQSYRAAIVVSLLPLLSFVVLGMLFGLRAAISAL